MFSFRSKNILLVSPESWGKNFVSKHHYAKELIKRDNRVYFLNPPGLRNNVVEHAGGLFVVDYKPGFRGVHHFPPFISSLLIKKEVKSLERKLGARFDVIWNFDPSRFFNLSSVKDALKICHIVDMSQVFQRDVLSKSSDICFCTSDYIKSELMHFNRNVFKIHHGFQYASEHIDVDFSPDPTKINVGYIGNLTRKCIDWDLFFDLVDRHQNMSFNLIGSYGHNNLGKEPLSKSYIGRLQKRKNVMLMGSKESRLLPGFLVKFDLLLCFYKVDSPEDIAQHSNLHKIMEYLGSGRAILTTYVDEYKNEKELLEMAEDQEDFLKKFDSIVSNLSHYNADQVMRKRIAYASNNSYGKQLDRIENYIKENLSFQQESDV